MPLLEQQNFLARIFTDENLRRSFWEKPEAVGKENGLTDSEIEQLKKIIPDDLNFFADSLFHKRLREVEKLLPLTKKALDKNFIDLFREFSNTFQPITVKKHLEDAIEFCKFIRAQDIDSNFAKDTANFEQKKHEFFGYGKIYSFVVLRHDVFSLRKKLGFAVWYRIGNQTYHFIL